MVDRNTLNRTWRCSTSVCEFITGQLNIRIAAHGIHATLIETITDAERTAALHADNTVIKLFYREHHRYGCYSMNWGVSKGLDHFQDVCIVMGPAHWKLLTRQELAALPPSSRNRLYVACSRARGNIYFVPETHLRRFRNWVTDFSVGHKSVKSEGHRRKYRLDRCGSGSRFPEPGWQYVTLSLNSIMPVIFIRKMWIMWHTRQHEIIVNHYIWARQKTWYSRWWMLKFSNFRNNLIWDAMTMVFLIYQSWKYGILQMLPDCTHTG